MKKCYITIIIKTFTALVQGPERSEPSLDEIYVSSSARNIKLVFVDEIRRDRLSFVSERKQNDNLASMLAARTRKISPR